MKKFIILLIISPIIPLMAQESGFRYIVGGQINFISVKGASYEGDYLYLSGDKGAKARNFDLQPYFAIKTSSHLLLGLRAGFGKRFNSYPNTYNDKTYYYKQYDHSFDAGFFVRYYFRPDAKFSLFFEPYAGFSQLKEKEVYEIYPSSSTYKTLELSAKIAPGLAYQLSEHFNLLFRLGEVGYAMKKEIEEDEDERRYDSLLLNFSLTSFTWGVEYRWGGKEREPKS